MAGVQLACRPSPYLDDLATGGRSGHDRQRRRTHTEVRRKQAKQGSVGRSIGRRRGDPDPEAPLAIDAVDRIPSPSWRQPNGEPDSVAAGHPRRAGAGAGHP